MTTWPNKLDQQMREACTICGIEMQVRLSCTPQELKRRFDRIEALILKCQASSSSSLSSSSSSSIPVVLHKVVAEVSKIGNLLEESTDGPKGGWSRVFWSGCNGCSGHLTTTAGCSVV